MQRVQPAQTPIHAGDECEAKLTMPCCVCFFHWHWHWHCFLTPPPLHPSRVHRPHRPKVDRIDLSLLKFPLGRSGTGHLGHECDICGVGACVRACVRDSHYYTTTSHHPVLLASQAHSVYAQPWPTFNRKPVRPTYLVCVLARTHAALRAAL